MIRGIEDIDYEILKYLNHDDIKNLSLVNKRLNHLCNIEHLNEILKNNHKDKVVKIIHYTKLGQSCWYCGNGSVITYLVSFEHGYGIIDNFSGCMTYEPWCNVILFDTYEKMKEYANFYEHIYLN